MLTSLATASVSWINGSYTPPVQTQSDPNFVRFLASATFTEEFMGQLQTGAISGDGEASATVGYGYFNLYVLAEDGILFDAVGGPSSVTTATASASFTDTITLFGGTGVANLVWDFQNIGSGEYGDSTFSYTLPAEATFGVPFTISVAETLQATAPPSIGGAGGSIDFALLGLTVNGTTDYQYYDVANTNYLNGTFLLTPEPSYAWLMPPLLCFAAFVKARAQATGSGT